ncbi:MAG: hypothetical protein MJ061_06905, partial [Mailhella sp.]|nr:hypothetical protein [Mailhella sp.]
MELTLDGIEERVRRSAAGAPHGPRPDMGGVSGHARRRPAARHLNENTHGPPARHLRQAAADTGNDMWNLTCLIDGTWKDVEYFDSIEEARSYLSGLDGADGKGWALINHALGEEFHGTSPADLLSHLSHS